MDDRCSNANTFRFNESFENVENVRKYLLKIRRSLNLFPRNFPMYASRGIFDRKFAPYITRLGKKLTNCSTCRAPRDSKVFCFVYNSNHNFYEAKAKRQMVNGKTDGLLDAAALHDSCSGTGNERCYDKSRIVIRKNVIERCRGR